MPIPSRSRICFDVSFELAEELRRSIPHGLQRYIFQFLAEDLVKAFNEEGNAEVITAIIKRQLTARRLLDGSRQSEEEHQRDDDRGASGRIEKD